MVVGEGSDEVLTSSTVWKPGFILPCQAIMQPNKGASRELNCFFVLFLQLQAWSLECMEVVPRA